MKDLSCPDAAQRVASSPRHSGARVFRASPESITPNRGYGFRACAQGGASRKDGGFKPPAGASRRDIAASGGGRRLAGCATSLLGPDLSADRGPEQHTVLAIELR